MEKLRFMHPNKKVHMKAQIPTPCHEDWNTMTPNERGRHCLSCQKTVVNFTNKSDAEIRQILFSHKEVCARMKLDQMNRELIKDPSPTKKWFQWGALTALLGLSFPTLSQKSSFYEREKRICVVGDTNQITPPLAASEAPLVEVPKDTVEQKVDSIPVLGELTFHIVDSNQQPIPFTKVIVSLNGKTLYGAISDFDGYAKINFSECPTEEVEVRISNYEYCDTTLLIDPRSLPFTQEVVLKTDITQLRMTVGMVITVPPHPMLHKASIPFRRVYYGARDRFYRNQH
jgi:hypothetical protein